MRRKRVIVAVTNDLYTDQRVDKICRYLVSKGAEVVLVGRLLPSSMELPSRSYQTHRMKLRFTQGPLFYAEFNCRLFFYLLFQKFDFLVSNDLDTLPACDFAASSKGKEVVYDSHEYFTEVPELKNKPLIRKFWEVFEYMIFRNLKRTYTVNDSIARFYNEKYRMNFNVVRNLPESFPMEKEKSRGELGLPEDKKILILQGAGINIQRGAEELTEAMRYLDNCHLVLVGSGDVYPILQQTIEKDPILKSRVSLIGKLPYRDMMQYTLNADLGFSIDKNTNLNYLYSLPNKLFDYIRAGIPVVVSDLVEVGEVVKEYKIGRIIEKHDPEYLADFISTFLKDESAMEDCRRNGKRAFADLNWENEIHQLDKIYQGLL